MRDNVGERYPARYYVRVDDQLHILAAMKNAWEERLTTVFPRQGCRWRFNSGPFWRRGKGHFDKAFLDRIPTLRAGVKAKPCRSLHEP
jgi:hypothetical protein